MLESLGSVVDAGLTLMWPFYLPLLVALGLSMLTSVPLLRKAPTGGSRSKGLLLAVCVALLGWVAILCALMPGLIAYKVSSLWNPIQMPGRLLEDLFQKQWTWRAGALIVVTALALWPCGVVAGTRLWKWFSEDVPEKPLRRWQRDYAWLLVAGFVGSIVVTQIVKAVLPGVEPLVLLGLGGVLTGLVVGSWVRSVAWPFDGDPLGPPGSRSDERDERPSVLYFPPDHWR